MPEYVYPGVYVEELAAEPHPIPGVATSSADSGLGALAAEVRRAVRAYAPDWTDSNDADPGVTILEAFGFLAEGLQYRSGAAAERFRAAARRAAEPLAAIAAGAADSGCGPLTRPLYFFGRLLDAASLEEEQRYQRAKRRLHDRELHGCGIVRGLDVRVDDAGGGAKRIVVDPGFAIDPQGEEIGLPIPVALALPASGDTVFATLRFWEHLCAPTPGGPSCRVEEACVVGLVPTPAPAALALARLLRDGGVWVVDPTFAPPRASPC